MCGERVGLPGTASEARSGTDFFCRIKDLNEHCLEEFRNHWKCLDNQNHQLWNCRSQERRLNSCVFDKLVRFITLLLLSRHLTRAEIGESYTRFAKGRHTRPLTGPPDLFVELSFVYYVRSRNTNHVNSTFQLVPVMSLRLRGGDDCSQMCKTM